MSTPIICFGQQPNGFFPKNFVVSKINTARKLQKEVGGKIVWFYHDSDADYRETITILHDKKSGNEVRLNFLQENKIQKKFSPLYAKRIPNGWKEEILKQLPRFVNPPTIEIFRSIEKSNVADFCLEMYEKLGLLEGIEVMRSSDKNFREAAPDLLQDYFADVKYQGEIVRAQMIEGQLKLHEGGGKYITLDNQTLQKSQKTPGRDHRLSWMQAVINCTHYIHGEGEKDYLNFEQHPEIKYIQRDPIENSDSAWLPS